MYLVTIAASSALTRGATVKVIDRTNGRARNIIKAQVRPTDRNGIAFTPRPGRVGVSKRYLSKPLFYLGK